MTGTSRPPGWALGTEAAVAELLRELTHALHPRDFGVIAWDEESGAARYIGTLPPDALRDAFDAMQANSPHARVIEVDIPDPPDPATPTPDGRLQ